MSLINNARKLYIEGIGEGNYTTAIEKYAGDEYIQHSTGVETGKEGFKEFFADFTLRHPKREMKIIHSFEEENLAFLFVVQNLDGKDKWVTMDIFRGDEKNMLVEHWDVIEEFKEPINDKFKFSENTLDLKGIIIDNLNEFDNFIKENNTCDYKYDNHRCYQILQNNNYVAMLSGFESGQKKYAQISLFEFNKNKLSSYWSTTEEICNDNVKNSGKF